MLMGFVPPCMYGFLVVRSISAYFYIYDWRHVLQRDLLGQNRLNTFPPEQYPN